MDAISLLTANILLPLHQQMSKHGQRLRCDLHSTSPAAGQTFSGLGSQLGAELSTTSETGREASRMLPGPCPVFIDILLLL
jgi:hypothetical protein